MDTLEEMYNDGAVQPELPVIPGFRFYPTEEELVGFYLKKRVQGDHQLNFDIVIPTLDLYRYDPWELPGLANDVGERQWFFFVPRESKKCARPTRLTVSGYWKATGSDRAIRNDLLHCIGLKKTLVFYKGKAPLGQRTDWIMNEYRIPSLLKKKIDTVICKIYIKAVSQKSMEQRNKRDPVEKGKLVVSAANEYEEKCHSMILSGGSSQSNPTTELANVPTLYYNEIQNGVCYSNAGKRDSEACQFENQKELYNCSNVSKMNNEANQFECLGPMMLC